MRMGTALALLIAALWPGAAAPAESSCIRCHVDEDEELAAPVEQWRRSAHARAEVSCDGCHGGDPLDDDEERSMSEDAGFVGSPSWYEVPELCGACHEQILAGYQESVMAAQIGDGRRVAVCTTCHMTEGHAIARVIPREILTEELCGKCHDAQRAYELRDALEATASRFDAAGVSLGEIHGRIDTGRVDRELRELRERYIVVAHTYDRARIAEVAEVSGHRFDSLARETDRLRDELRFRRRLGVGVVGFFALACVGALRLERDLRARRR